LDVTTAAATLGISTESVRKRLLRGTLAGRKIEGKWEVDLPGRPAPPDAVVLPDRTLVQDGSGREQDAPPRVDDLLQRITWLEQRVEAAEVERAELRRLLAEALHQAYQLPPAQDAAPHAEESEKAPVPVEVVQTAPAPARGFWARLFGR
jgi:hypothetical protein